MLYIQQKWLDFFFKIEKGSGQWKDYSYSVGLFFVFVKYMKEIENVQEKGHELLWRRYTIEIKVQFNFNQCVLNFKKSFKFL